MKPACEIEEYASSRLMFDWTSAAMLPHASEMHGEDRDRDRPHVRAPPGTRPVSTRYMRTSATVFVAAAMKPVTGVGAPS